MENNNKTKIKVGDTVTSTGEGYFLNLTPTNNKINTARILKNPHSVGFEVKISGVLGQLFKLECDKGEDYFFTSESFTIKPKVPKFEPKEGNVYLITRKCSKNELEKLLLTKLSTAHNVPKFKYVFVNVETGEYVYSDILSWVATFQKINLIGAL